MRFAFLPSRSHYRGGYWWQNYLIMKVNIKIAIDKTRAGNKIASYLVIDGVQGKPIELKHTDAEKIISYCELKIKSALPNSGGTISHLFE